MLALNRKKRQPVKDRNHSSNGKTQEKSQGNVLSRKPKKRDSLRQKKSS